MKGSWCYSSDTVTPRHRKSGRAQMHRNGLANQRNHNYASIIAEGWSKHQADGRVVYRPSLFLLLPTMELFAQLFEHLPELHVIVC